ncbi:NADH dehydrogenase [ubiquinone] flavoprotein 3, mitochondrial [Frankliniella fusca]|uniref:NADH dehydrogenase [ubiquinone] flavoprotein 3, mitochondrial n=1 Tax=Frankliniella fusca TaxID=407009 RepID=A0AAE1HU00_9NEOP|nr:NADH dehydrogenase [ubiquinone] flavoprotein 3, mitochondrial [Frankliniella fusca]
MAATVELRIASKILGLCRLNPRFQVCGSRLYSSAKGSSKSSSGGASGSSSTSTPNVTGLSKKVLDVPNTEVGPGASKSTAYKNPEYFCYNPASYFEAEVELLKYRCPQPSALTPKS